MEQLQRAFESGRVAHAYLFCGPEGVGKEMVARWFARLLNCSGNPPRPCGECRDCRLLESMHHPDLRLIASLEELERRGLLEEEKKGALSSQIRMEQLDELSALLRHRPYQGRFKMVLVIDAHQMNLHTQNRFLKTLEEPTDDTVLVLVTHRPEALLPTVRSRCQSLFFGTLPAEAIAQELERRGQESGQATAVAALAQGSLGRALELAEAGALELRDRLAQALEKMSRLEADELLWLAEELAQRDVEQLLVLELLEWLCRDALLLRLGAPAGALVNRDLSGQVEKAAGRLNARGWWRCIRHLRRSRAWLELYSPARVVMESALLGLRAG